MGEMFANPFDLVMSVLLLALLMATAVSFMIGRNLDAKAEAVTPSKLLGDVDRVLIEARQRSENK